MLIGLLLGNERKESSDYRFESMLGRDRQKGPAEWWNLASDLLVLYFWGLHSDHWMRAHKFEVLFEVIYVRKNIRFLISISIFLSSVSISWKNLWKKYKRNVFFFLSRFIFVEVCVMFDTTCCFLCLSDEQTSLMWHFSISKQNKKKRGENCNTYSANLNNQLSIKWWEKDIDVQALKLFTKWRQIYI